MVRLMPNIASTPSYAATDKVNYIIMSPLKAVRSCHENMEMLEIGVNIKDLGDPRKSEKAFVKRGQAFAS